MCSNENVHQAFLQVCNGLFLLCRCLEPAHQINPHREVFHSLDKGIVMLLRQNSSGHQIHHLFSFLHCFEGNADGNFCFSISNITANQAVHNLGAFHILFGRLNGKKLVLGLLKRKHFFKFPLPDRIRLILVT